MKRVVLTRHADLKRLERELLLSWIEQTARDPQWIEPEPGDPSADRRFRAIADGRILRVVCVETETAIRVITAMFDRRARSTR